MSTLPKQRITREEYLARERQAEYKSEFYNGEVFAMTGASREHNLITVNVARRLSEQLDDRPCEVYAADMRIKIDRTGLYAYPDVAVTCEEPQFEDEHVDTLLNPQVLIEVLSESTEAFDRGKKFEHYRHIPTLREFVLVSQDSYLVECYSRQGADQWLLAAASNLGGDWLVLDSILCKIALADIYARVKIADGGAPSP